MHFFLRVLLIAFLCAAAEYFLPWWSIAVVCFLVSLLIKQGKGKAFLMGFCGVGLFWLVTALLRDLSNEHILSTKMAVLFHLPHYALFILVTSLIGALIGGLAAWAGALVRPKTDIAEK